VTNLAAISPNGLTVDHPPAGTRLASHDRSVDQRPDRL